MYAPWNSSFPFGTFIHKCGYKNIYKEIHCSNAPKSKGLEKNPQCLQCIAIQWNPVQGQNRFYDQSGMLLGDKMQSSGYVCITFCLAWLFMERKSLEACIGLWQKCCLQELEDRNGREACSFIVYPFELLKRFLIIYIY